MGGLWEAAVKSAKHHLHKVAVNSHLTFEEFTTLLTQAESALNSRPITSISVDSQDPEALFPSHFLIGTHPSSIPEPDSTSTNMNKLSHWKQVQALYQPFWKRWSQE